MLFLVFALVTVLVISWMYFYFKVNVNNPKSCVCPAPTEPITQHVVYEPPPGPYTRQHIAAHDKAVITDPLYPPINRPDVDNATRLLNTPALYSRQSSDNYRLIAYLINTEDKNDVWKLFAKQKGNTSRGDATFYVSSANQNLDVKIHLSDEMLGSTSARLRDIYNLPDSLTIKHPLFSSSPYSVAPLPSMYSDL